MNERNKQIRIMERELKRRYFNDVKQPQKEYGKRKVIFYRTGSSGGYYWWAPEEKEEKE